MIGECIITPSPYELNIFPLDLYGNADLIENQQHKTLSFALRSTVVKPSLQLTCQQLLEVVRNSEK